MVGMGGSRHSRTRHPRLYSRRGRGVLCRWWSITHSNASARPICKIRLPRECRRSGCLSRWAAAWGLLEACSRVEGGNVILEVLRRWGTRLGGRIRSRR